MNSPIAVIPAFEPNQHLTHLVRQLQPVFDNLIVIDDGSCSGKSVFDELRTIDKVTVLGHEENRGKGAALKTAFREVLRKFPDTLGVVTIDADGQHLPQDVSRVANALIGNPGHLVLGVRDFGRHVPARSKLGNLWTIAEFRLLTGQTVHDTQTGLRGIPRTLLPALLEIPGDRYEYEIRMLVRVARQFDEIIQLPITTVYEQGNATSHYRPFVDTLKTQYALFSEAFSAHRT